MHFIRDEAFIPLQRGYPVALHWHINLTTQKGKKQVHHVEEHSGFIKFALLMDIIDTCRTPISEKSVHYYFC